MKSQNVLEREDERFLIGWAQAQQAAKILCEHPAIKAVIAFGSVARENEGEDLDVIFVCDEVIAADFFYYVERELLEGEGGVYANAKYTRMDVALTALADEKLDVILARMRQFVDIYDMDIFIFPSDWRNRLEELQQVLPHSDPQFMRNIARNARGLWVKQ